MNEETIWNLLQGSADKWNRKCAILWQKPSMMFSHCNPTSGIVYYYIRQQLNPANCYKPDNRIVVGCSTVHNV